jgi:prefoldin alpha subunit
MPSLEEDRVRMNYEVAIYREQLTMLRREMERISLTTLDISNAIQAVEGLKSMEILTPVGGGVLVRSDIKDTKVLVPIGAEFVIEMDRQEASAELQRRFEATKQAVSKLNEEFEKINKKLKQVAGSLQELESQLKLSKQVEAGVKEDYI